MEIEPVGPESQIPYFFNFRIFVQLNETENFT